MLPDLFIPQSESHNILNCYEEKVNSQDIVFLRNLNDFGERCVMSLAIGYII